jgi:hypothetical protein
MVIEEKCEYCGVPKSEVDQRDDEGLYWTHCENCDVPLCGECVANGRCPDCDDELRDEEYGDHDDE